MSKSQVIWTTTFVALLGASATMQTSGRADEVLKQARAYAFQIREGHYDVAPKAVAFLEEATAAEPTNAKLLAALSSAYFSQATAASQPGANQMDALKAVQQGFAAGERALAADPNEPNALSVHGAALTITAVFSGKPELIGKGMAEMSRAVELQPTTAPPRLVRGFFGVNLPPAARNNALVIEDLKFLSSMAEGSRAGDTVHVLLGDLYAEIGQKDEARHEYAAATHRPASTAREMVSVRVAALDAGTLPTAQTAQLRTSLGSNCTICHAR